MRTLTADFDKTKNLKDEIIRVVKTATDQIIIKEEEWNKVEQLLNGEIKRRNFVNIESQSRKEYQVQLEEDRLVFVSFYGNNAEVKLENIK